ncbi:putative GMC oxidoreductase [Rostrohypoxylon terebratum]|nr:putative GMC oxidoreductase [Rostrohypoxylon terebratum]
MQLTMKATLSWILLASAAKVGCESFDYIIAGAGTCGLVLANRLSEDPNVRVAVIEPGGDVRNNINVTDVTRFLRAFGTPIDWQYTMTPQPGANNRTLEYHAGKAIGGTSTINGMTYIRGDKAEFDAWETLGNEGWNWESLYPYFKGVERFTYPTAAQIAAGASFNSEYHGEDGPLTTGFPFELLNGSFYRKAQAAWQTLGYPLNPDVNGGNTSGFSIWPQTLDRDANIREDAARAFYYPIEQRPNFKIIRGTVTKVTWANSSTNGLLTADGVEYRDSNKNETITVGAAREVLLAAGSLRTPLILERSGVGNPNILKKFGIETKIELNGVGENLIDQPNTSLEYSSSVNSTGTMPYATFVTAQDIFGTQTSMVADEIHSKIPEYAQKVSDANGGAITPSQLEKIFQIQHDLIFNKHVTIAESLTSGAGNILISAFWTLLPFSRGSVHMTSAQDIDDQAIAIDPKYFDIDFDLAVQTGVGRISQELWYTEPISGLVASYLVPGDAELPRNASDAQWAKALGSLLTANHHALGTASMMPRELGGVVNPSLQLYGASNVRIVDASVLPTQISGHLTATLYAVAERAADLMKNS